MSNGQDEKDLDELKRLQAGLEESSAEMKKLQADQDKMFEEARVEGRKMLLRFFTGIDEEE